MRHQADGGRADRSSFRHRSCAVAVLLVAAPLDDTVAPCGSGAVEGPADKAASVGGGGNSGGEEFSLSLPDGDLSLDSIGTVFNTLRVGKHEHPETNLNGSLGGEPGLWSPHQEHLYRSAIASCSGDLVGGREFLAGASLTTHPGDYRRLHKAIRSVLAQRSQESIDCPDPQSETGTSSTESTTTTESSGSTTEPTTTSSTETTAPDGDDGGSVSRLTPAGALTKGHGV